MFDTLVYIPTILAYTFISLLVVILGFIVIYVSHKIYVTIYDNLPVAQLSSSSSKISEKIKTMAQPSALVSGSVGRKSKTVTLEPCYLAYMVLKTGPHSATSNINPMLNYLDVSEISRQDSYASGGGRLVQYYDNLSAIPTSRSQQNCDMIGMLSLDGQ